MQLDLQAQVFDQAHSNLFDDEGLIRYSSSVYKLQRLKLMHERFDAREAYLQVTELALMKECNVYKTKINAVVNAVSTRTPDEKERNLLDEVISILRSLDA